MSEVREVLERNLDGRVAARVALLGADPLFDAGTVRLAGRVVEVTGRPRINVTPTVLKERFGDELETFDFETKSQSVAFKVKTRDE
ncbi:MAG: hypothetical protein HY791_28980 [Deltaproteobacteria bacterium]|nr:hypothetical protein [Deltaproteobacteria bacterium]